MNTANETGSFQLNRERLRRAGLQIDYALRDRARAIVNAKKAGMSIRQIAEASDLSPSRIHQLLNSAKDERPATAAAPAEPQRRQALRHCALFESLDDTTIDLLAGRVVPKTFAKRTVLMFEGDVSDSMYVVVSGTIDVYADEPNGKEVLLNVLGAGDCLGELAMLDQKPRSASARTRSVCKVLMLTRTAFAEVVAECPGVALELLAVLVDRVRSQTEQTKGLALKSAYQRLVDAFDDFGQRSDDGRCVLTDVTHRRLADHIHVSREMVTRLLKDLKDGGYIETEHRQITIKKRLPPFW